MSLSFFEALAIADQERIHSQMLAWMLAPATAGAPLDADQRRTLLSKVFGFELTANTCERLRVQSELRRLDLVVLSGDSMLVVENKLKSRQGRHQLPRYDDEIRELKTLLGLSSATAIHKCFLTYSGEASGEDGWLDVDYGRLHRTLLEIQPRNVYVRDYAGMLGRLIHYRDTFLSDHTAHTRVFKRSGMPNEDRITLARGDHETDVERFAFDNRFERLLCEALLIRLGGALTPGAHFVSETRGGALIDTGLFSFRCSLDRTFNVGLQLQGRAVKLNVSAAEYHKSIRAQIGTLEGPLDAAMLAVLGRDHAATRSKPNAARKHAYRSWSYRLPIMEALEARPLKTFVEEHDTRLRWASEVWRDVLSRLSARGVVNAIEQRVPRARVAIVEEADLPQ